MRKLALKKLKESDLSFFKSHFTKHEQRSKQKGFNLDTSLLEGLFYPGLKDYLSPRPKKSTHVDLSIYGPNAAPAYSLARKIKIDAKNLRLNGELIHDPDDQPGRFDSLQDNDLAIFEFGGSPFPDSVSVVLLSSLENLDATLHAELSSLMMKRSGSMCEITEEELQNAVEVANPVSIHPIRIWLEMDLIEAVGAGNSAAVEEAARRRPNRGMSTSDLKAAKASAELTGEIGEEILDFYLGSNQASFAILHKWVSLENAISPYDFYLETANSGVRHVDAKSTSGKFESPLYLSTAEIRHALSSDIPYDIYRLYQVTRLGAKIRIAHDIKNQLQPLMATLKTLPIGVSIDSMSFKPGFFSFEDEELTVDLNSDNSDYFSN